MVLRVGVIGNYSSDAASLGEVLGTVTVLPSSLHARTVGVDVATWAVNVVGSNNLMQLGVDSGVRDLCTHYPVNLLWSLWLVLIFHYQQDVGVGQSPLLPFNGGSVRLDLPQHIFLQ